MQLGGVQMDDKIKILLDRINIDNANYQYFNDAKITRIVVSSKTKSWNIYIDKYELLPRELKFIKQANSDLKLFGLFLTLLI